MKKNFKTLCVFLGRLFISVAFLTSALKKVFTWQQAQSDFSTVLSDWLAHLNSFPFFQQLVADLLPISTGLLAVMTLMEFFGGIFLLFNIKARFGVFLLLIFFIPATILFHQFWFFQGDKRELELLLFMKNIAIIGGLFYALACGGKSAGGEGGGGGAKK